MDHYHLALKEVSVRRTVGWGLYSSIKARATRLQLFHSSDTVLNVAVSSVEKCLKEINAHLYRLAGQSQKVEAIGKQMNKYAIFYTTIEYHFSIKNECDKTHNRDKKEARDKGPHTCLHCLIPLT